jgi:uncharacterized protein (TIGR01777 family)
MVKHILITGASGLVGSRLTELLLQKGHQVSHLGRSKKNTGSVKSFVWDVNKGTLDEHAFEGVDSIIHLAGAGVAEKRWTNERKKEILESRTKSTALLCASMARTQHRIESVVSASAIGIYGFCLDERIFTEQTKPGTDFLSQVTKQWEDEVDKIANLGLRTVKIRIGIVLSNKGGALQELAKPVRYGFGASLGSGRQYMSWIHIDDLCGMFIKAVEDNTLYGAYNGVCDWITNKAFTRVVANTLKKPLWLPPVPGFVMNLLVGEMAEIIVNGSKVSSEKIRTTGFSYKFPALTDALNDSL